MQIEEYISQTELDNRVSDLGKQISKDYAGKNVYIICIMRGAFMFAADLVRQITVPVHMDFIDASSKIKGEKKFENFHIRYPLRYSVEGKHVLILEDMVATGITLTCLKEYIGAMNPKSLKVGSLLYKSELFKTKLQLDYYGFEIEDKLVVGYGMDYQGEYRALPYIAALNPEE